MIKEGTWENTLLWAIAGLGFWQIASTAIACVGSRCFQISELDQWTTMIISAIAAFLLASDKNIGWAAISSMIGAGFAEGIMKASEAGPPLIVSPIIFCAIWIFVLGYGEIHSLACRILCFVCLSVASIAAVGEMIGFKWFYWEYFSLLGIAGLLSLYVHTYKNKGHEYSKIGLQTLAVIAIHFLLHLIPDYGQFTKPYAWLLNVWITVGLSRMAINSMKEKKWKLAIASS